MHPEPNGDSDPSADNNNHRTTLPVRDAKKLASPANCALSLETRDQADLNPTNVNFWLTEGSE